MSTYLDLIESLEDQPTTDDKKVDYLGLIEQNSPERLGYLEAIKDSLPPMELAQEDVTAVKSPIDRVAVDFFGELDAWAAGKYTEPGAKNAIREQWARGARQLAALPVQATLGFATSIIEHPVTTLKNLPGDFAGALNEAVNNFAIFVSPLSTPEQKKQSQEYMLNNPTGFALATVITAAPTTALLKGGAKPFTPRTIKPIKQSSSADAVIQQYNKQNLSIGEQKAVPSNKLTVKLEEAYTSLVNKDFPIEKAANIAGDTRIKGLLQRVRGIAGVARSSVLWKTTKLVGDEMIITGKGLAEIIRPMKKYEADLRALLTAQRDIELWRRGGIKGVNPRASGRTLRALREKWGEGYGDLGRTTVEIRGWSDRAILQPLRDEGIISEASYAAIKKDNRFYSPYQRLFDDLDNAQVTIKGGRLTPSKVPLQKIKGSTRQKIDPLESFIVKAGEVSAVVERARVARHTVDLRNMSKELADLITPVEQLGKNTITVFRNGNKEFYQVPPDLFQSLQGTGSAEMNWLGRLVRGHTRLLRAGATLDPLFQIRNPFKDQFSAYVFSRHGYIPGVDLVTGIFEMAKRSDLYQEFHASGAGHATLVGLDRPITQLTLDRVLGKGKAKDALKTAINPIKALQVISNFMEEGTRVGGFKRARRKGASTLQSIDEARELTLDFGRMGTIGGQINSIKAFWNANVQGLDKLTRTFQKRPMEATTKAIIGITTPSVLLWLKNHTDPEYAEIPGWRKDLFWVFKVPEGTKNLGPFSFKGSKGGQWYAMPKPFHLGIIFGSAPERVLDFIANKDPAALKNVFGTLLTSVEGLAPVPTSLVPPIESITNYSFFKGEKLVPTFLEENRPPGLQSFEFTSDTAKKIGESINVSPIKVENFIRGTGAGLAKIGLEIADAALRKAGLVEPRAEFPKTLSDVPVIGGLAIRPPRGAQSESAQRFYKLYTKAKQHHQAVISLLEEGKEKEAEKWGNRFPEHWLYPAYEGINRAMSTMYKTRRFILASPDISVDEKADLVKQLDLDITRLAQEALKMDLAERVK